MRLTNEEIKQAIISNRRSAEVEGIVIDPYIDELSLKMLKGEITNSEARRIIYKKHGFTERKGL